MCSLHLKVMTRSPGTRMMAAKRLQSMLSPHQRILPTRFMRRMWMGTGTWTCSLHLEVMIRLPGMSRMGAQFLRPLMSPMITLNRP